MVVASDGELARRRDVVDNPLRRGRQDFWFADDMMGAEGHGPGFRVWGGNSPLKGRECALRMARGAKLRRLTQKSSTVLNCATLFIFFAQSLAPLLFPLCRAPSNHSTHDLSKG